MSEANERPTCATCKHYVPTHWATRPLGECRAHPPPPSVPSYRTKWPEVEPGEFCGEHARIPYSAPVPTKEHG